MKNEVLSNLTQCKKVNYITIGFTDGNDKEHEVTLKNIKGQIETYISIIQNYTEYTKDGIYLKPFDSSSSYTVRTEFGCDEFTAFEVKM